MHYDKNVKVKQTQAANPSWHVLGLCQKDWCHLVPGHDGGFD